MGTITINTPPGLIPSIHESANVRELFNFENTAFTSEVNLSEDEIQETTIKYRIIGDLPNNLELIDEDSCIIYGEVIDIDSNNVYELCEEAEPIQVDGSNYAKCYSAKEGSHDFLFNIEAYCNIKDTITNTIYEIMDSKEYIIRVVNNYSSDRDQFIRKYSEEHGTVNENGDKVCFLIDGVPSTAEDYLTYQKSLGNFPQL